MKLTLRSRRFACRKLNQTTFNRQMLLITQLPTLLRKLTCTIIMHNCRVNIGNVLCYTKLNRNWITLTIIERAIIGRVINGILCMANYCKFSFWQQSFFMSTKILQHGRGHYIVIHTYISYKHNFTIIFTFLLDSRNFSIFCM